MFEFELIYPTIEKNHKRRMMMSAKKWMSLIIVFLLLASCNLPAGNATAVEESPQSSDVDAVGISVELTTVARMTEAAGSAVAPLAVDSTTAPIATPTETPSPTPCIPLVTATTNANVRSGPDTAYVVVGSLSLGATAEVAGRNDNNSWWYIKYAGASGGYAWIAGSVVTTSCLPAVVQVVAAPPLPPTATPTNTEVPPIVVAAKPDVHVSEYTWSPSPPHMGVSFHVRVGAYNQGDAAAGAFTVQWWLSTSAPAPACTWNIPSMAAHGGRILECDYIPGGWANYPSQVVVDSGNTLDESDEGNNIWSETLSIQP